MRPFIFISGLLLVQMAFSQEQTAPSSATLPEITVLGDLPGKSKFDVAPTVSELSGPQLNRKKQTTLGETLASEVGVSSSFFGPNSSRPVIRGMDGERIRILNNGLGVLDASGASQDHAVSLDPLTIERVEIVRGPSALLYGSSAVGGVINVVTNRILEVVPDGLEGKADLKSSSVDQGQSGALGLNVGVGQWAFHLDGASKDTKNYKIPGFARTAEKRANDPLDAEAVEGNGSVPNSSSRTWNGALGGSYIFDKGFAGVSYSTYDSNYGTVAEQSVRIQMKQDRWDASLGLKDLGWVKSLRLKNSYSIYKHEELEGSEIGTAFKNRGNETRLEIAHQPVGAWGGLFGLQSNVFNFSAVGAESFLPETDNSNLAAFIYEEATFGPWTPSVGLRVDTYSVKANETLVDVDPNNPGESSPGGTAENRNFAGESVSLGVIYAFNAANSLALSLAYTERAPNYQELFANGPHVATGAYERGDMNLGKEKSQSAELSYRYKQEDTSAVVGVFVQDFNDYISLSPKAGGGFDPEGSPGNRDLALYQYEQVDAHFYGSEIEVKHAFSNLLPKGVFELGLKVDLVKARNKTTGDNLPRITPMRETLSAEYKSDKFSVDMEIQRAEKQTALAPNETETLPFELVNLGTEIPWTIGNSVVEIYGRVHNVFDKEARNHVSFLKDIAPLPGRNFIAGIRASF